METKTFKIVNHNELEEMIRSHFEKPYYNIVAEEEWNNDSIHTFSITGTVMSPDKVDDFRSGKKYGTFMLSDILEQMVADGVLEPGDYLVNVCR